jgi:alpha-aminoadipate carrier protein LysW
VTMAEQPQNATCPECGAEWELSGVEQGEIVTCPDCGVDLEVLTTNPISVGLAPEEGEDWGEYSERSQTRVMTRAKWERRWRR